MTFAGRINTAVIAALIFGLSACNCGGVAPAHKGDGGPSDAGATDGGPDAGEYPDGGRRVDAGPAHDAGHVDAGGCGLRTCASAGANCGPLSDGCGGILQCGDCLPPHSCGGGGVPSFCGGNGGCVPLTCGDAGATCGPLGDGCGNLLNCGTCTTPETCGGGVPYQCGAAPHLDGGRLEPDSGCLPLTCGQANANCGPVGDGCGSLIQCGACPTTEACGAGGVASTCAPPTMTCVPRSCLQLSATCGEVGDGCGSAIECGLCDAGYCGGGGVANQCGFVDAGSSCTGLCLNQVVCGDGGTTSISGTVYAPTDPDAGFGLPDPLPNALVYIANGPVAPFAEQISCDVCGAPASGNPLVTATTALDGGFVLKDVPAGVDLNLVIQMGRWRRQVPIPAVTACQNTALPAEQTRMPRNHTEGDIPHIAMVTGGLDSVECVLRKMGIQDGEFGTPDGGARVDLYEAPNIFGGYGALGPDGGVSDLETLVSNPTLMSTYDLVILACTGSEVDQGNDEQNNLIAYTGNGGRVYATHYAYVWLFNDPPFDMTANWDVSLEVDGGGTDNGPDITTVNDVGMAGWLDIVHASTTPGQIPMTNNRWNFTSSNAPSETWLTDLATGWPLHYTFNTPVGAAGGAQCGRVVFSDFHVENAQVSNTPFPQECAVAPMTPQEKVLEFMLFDLANCVTQTSPPPLGCTPGTCVSEGFNCGLQGDGCGDLIDGGCGTCPPPQTCGGAGVAGVCGGGTACQPETCSSLGLSCGQAGNGCGGMIDGGCGTCPPPQTCGGGGVSGQCGEITHCTPTTCASEGLECGPAGDGCGGIIDGGCGSCAPPALCGGAGVSGKCGMPPCTPETCQGLGYQCGATGDGCGGLIQCGACDGGTCGGGLHANQCGTFEFQ